jgi:hypothetical protein
MIRQKKDDMGFLRLHRYTHKGKSKQKNKHPNNQNSLNKVWLQCASEELTYPTPEMTPAPKL